MTPPVDPELLDRFERAVRSFKRATDAMRSHRKLMAMAGGIELDMTSVPLLMRIREGEPQRLSDLAVQMWLDTSVVSRKVSKLVADGLLERVPDPDDARAALVGLTPLGVEIGERLSAARRTFIENSFTGWAEDDLTAFVTLFERYAESVATMGATE